MSNNPNERSRDRAFADNLTNFLNCIPDCSDIDGTEDEVTAVFTYDVSDLRSLPDRIRDTADEVERWLK